MTPPLRDYHVWRWASNNSFGRPTEIVAELYSGLYPVALESFDSKPVLEQVEALKSDPAVAPDCLISTLVPSGTESVMSIVVSSAHLDPRRMGDKILKAVWDFGLTVFDESENRLLGLPKHNVLERPDYHQRLDSSVGDIPVLLREMRASSDVLAFYDRNGNMFQVWKSGRRYCVEWQILPDRDFEKHRIWIAGKRPEAPNRTRLGQHLLFGHEVLSYSDVRWLWEAFFSSSERPNRYEWREITANLKQHSEGPDRMRYHESRDG